LGALFNHWFRRVYGIFM